jgi:hypothetical protein
MHSGDLTTRQAEQLMTKVRPMVMYLGSVRARMVEQGFPPHDELLLIVDKAHDAVHHLFVDLHYRTCKGQTY